MFSLPVKQQFFNLRIYDIAYIMHFHTTFKSRVLKRSIYIRCEAKQNKMFVCENPGGQKKVHQAGREFIFFLFFRIYIQTKFSKEQKK